MVRVPQDLLAEIRFALSERAISASVLAEIGECAVELSAEAESYLASHSRFTERWGILFAMPRTPISALPPAGQDYSYPVLVGWIESGHETG